MKNNDETGAKTTAPPLPRIPLLSFAENPTPETGHDMNFVLPVARLIEDAAGFLLYGGPGSGKTHACRFMLEQAQGHIQQIIFDSEGEFYTLREVYPYLLAAKEDGDVPLTLATAGVLCERVMELGISLIIDLSGMRIEERPHYVAAFLTQLLETPKTLWRPVLVAIDEVHRFAPEGGNVASSSMVANLPAVGRKRGFLPLYATQNVEQVSKDAIGYLPNKLVGKITMDNRRKRAADDFGLPSEDRTRLKNMQRGQFFAQGPAFGNDTILLALPDTQTHKPQVGAGYQSPPAAPAAIQELLKHFATLPEEAETEAASLAEARRVIAGLRSRVKDGPKPEVVTREIPVERIVYQEKIVEVPVPVLADGQIEQMLGIADGMVAMGKDLLAEASAIRVQINQFTHRKRSEMPENQEAEQAEAVGASVSAAETAAVPSAVVPVVISDSLGNSDREIMDIKISAPQQRILDTVATFATFGTAFPHRSNVAAWAGTSATSGTFRNNMSALRSLGLIDYPSAVTITLTASGRGRAKKAAVPISQKSLLSAWQKRLPGPVGRILEYLWERRGNRVSRHDLALAMGSSDTSGSFRNNLSSLRSLGLIDYPNTTTVAATNLILAPELPVE